MFMETINIVCATDNNYAPYCGIMLTSLFESNKDCVFSVYVLINGDFSSQNKRKYKMLEEFMEKHYSLTRMCSSLHQLEEVIVEEHFDAVITGGDQIWNMDCWDFSPAYYLPFETPGVRRLSYAPSFGGMHGWKPQHYGNMLLNLLGNYDYVSVREKEAARYLTELLGRVIPSVADPVFLLDKSEYEKLTGKEPIINGDYLYYYSPMENHQIEQLVNDYATKHGLRVVISNGTGKGLGDCIHKNDSGPKEFLNLMLNAKVVVGRSFHLAVFSLIFHKDFYVVTDVREFRMGGLLESVGLQSRYVLTGTGFPIVEQTIDWNGADAFLENERKNAIVFLNETLG